MKPFDTTTPSSTRYDAPETFTVKRAKAVMLAFLAAGLFVLATWTVAQGWTTAAVVAAVLALFVAFNAWLLWEYSSRLVERELPRNRQTKPATGSDRQRVIYTHNEVKPKAGGGYTVEQSKHETRFSFDVAEVASAVAWMLKADKFDRRAVTQRMGWSGEKFTTIMRELEQFGMATNGGAGRGWKLDAKAYDWAQSLSTDIDSIADELDRM